MLRLFSRGKPVPQDQYTSRLSKSDHLSRAKLAAWAIVVGERPRSADPPFRPSRRHRAMLDDLPQPEMPELMPMPLVRVMVELMGRLLEFRSGWADSDGTVAGYKKSPVGDEALVTYIDGRDAIESNPSVPSGNEIPNANSRAA